MPRLTKDERDAIRRDQHRQMTEWHSHDISQVLRLLDSHDEAEAENAKLRTLARSLYSRAVDGDDFADKDIAELRSFGLVDGDGFPVYGDDE